MCLSGISLQNHVRVLSGSKILFAKCLCVVNTQLPEAPTFAYESGNAATAEERSLPSAHFSEN